MHRNYKEPVQSLKLFSNGLIDYAGLFPPASLNLAQAFNNYIMYNQGNYKWMLSRFIIPALKLTELSELLQHLEFPNGLTLKFSILGTGGDNENKFKENFSCDIKLINDFIQKFGNKIFTDAFEVRLPSELVNTGSTKDLTELMSFISGNINDILKFPAKYFYECILNDDFSSRLVKTAEALSLNNGNTAAAGFKLRTGGTEASAFPSPEQIAFAIMTCLEYGVPMKCTAGLHHPIRHYDESIKANMHGFLNVFGAGIFAYNCNMDEDDILQILNESEPYSFHFFDDGIEWNDIALNNSEISDARENFMISYGSCSFDEPIEDLKTMELL